MAMVTHVFFGSEDQLVVAIVTKYAVENFVNKMRLERQREKKEAI